MDFVARISTAVASGIARVGLKYCMQNPTQQPNAITEHNAEQTALQLAVGGQYQQERAVHWLQYREHLVDPTHTLNQSPILTLLVLDKWLRAPQEHNVDHPNAKRWVQQCFQACLAWEWPTNATATELHYRLGSLLLAKPDAVSVFIKDASEWHNLIGWCFAQENTVCPNLNNGIARFLKNENIDLVAPHEIVLDALVKDWTDNPREITLPGMEILWRSSYLRDHPDSAKALSLALPDSLPNALVYQMSCTRALAKTTRPPAPYPPALFAMDPARCDAQELFNVLLRIYKDPTLTALWETMSTAWPAYTSLFSTLEAMHGPESLMETSDADSSFVQYLRNIQLEPVVSYHEGLHAALDSAHHWTI